MALILPDQQHHQMTSARCDLMPPGQSGTFHIVARCVRRSFLWGFDTYSNQNYARPYRRCSVYGWRRLDSYTARQ